MIFVDFNRKWKVFLEIINEKSLDLKIENNGIDSNY